MRKITIEATPRITITLYKGHLPIAYGHLEPEGGRTWLAISVAHGYTEKGNGEKLMKALCDYADNAGWELWLTCHDKWLVGWYSAFGFNLVNKKGDCRYMKRGKE